MKNKPTIKKKASNGMKSVVHGSADKWSKIKWSKKVLQKAQENHIWLNAFDCVRPTPAFCESLGRSIINKLRDEENLIPMSGITSDVEAMREIAKLTPIMYMSINKS